jgi:hypothetical protein
MNTNGISKLYHQLSSRERLPLILAASARGDDLERDRLARSAPREAFRVPDYFGLADGIQMQAIFHVNQLLDLAAIYWRGSEMLAHAGEFPPEERKARRKQMRDLVRALAYTFTAHVDGWKRFCEEWKLDGEVLLQSLPGFGTVREAEQSARGMAFTAEEATDWMRRTGDNPTARPITADDVAARMQAFVESRAEWWGVG